MQREGKGKVRRECTVGVRDVSYVQRQLKGQTGVYWGREGGGVDTCREN